MIVERVGNTREPVLVIDDFVPDAEALREYASKVEYAVAANHYPGIRADLPAGYLQALRSLATPPLSEALGRPPAIDVIDASFSIVTTPRDELTVAQRLPHCDAFEPNRFAMVHYLSSDTGGTAFYRHRSTGFETVDRQRAAILFPHLEAEIRHRGAPAPSYVADGAPLFERMLDVSARFNRAIFYRSWLLHSGSVAPEAELSADPATGRLTVTAFFAAD
ncbi:MAG: hypothetical protein J0I47_00775 [Sphingomonas sp.]|uniref:DUF6445 family protein n=1 Tax=Sphingomonas sp. TaxID=28214 RepID=UPI001ACFADCB|nr:DUF6445 family protein [Sphingomonas sp.]MBN8806763.1 hypothetical protein [Sphingomonas sp.]